VGSDKERDYVDVSYIPNRESGLLWVDTSALNHIGPFNGSASEISRLQSQKARSCLKFLKTRGGVVTTMGILEEMSGTVEYYQHKKKRVRRAMFYERKIKRENRGGNVKSFPSRFGQTLDKNRSNLFIYRAMYEFLRTQSEENFPNGVGFYEFSVVCNNISEALKERSGVQESRRSLYNYLMERTRESFPESGFGFSGICSAWAHFVYLDDNSRLSLPDKELLVASIYAGNRCGLFSADGLMMLAYREAVKRFSLSDCFVCDGINSRTDWLGQR